jgi:hypothetical protein
MLKNVKTPKIQKNDLADFDDGPAELNARQSRTLEARVAARRALITLANEQQHAEVQSVRTHGRRAATARKRIKAA